MTAGDPEIRAALHAHINRTAPAGSVVIDELGLEHGFVRADVGVVQPTALDLFEIKSDLDHGGRLRLQVQVYGMFATRAALVAGPKILPRVLHIVPEWWAVYRCTNPADGLELLRAGDVNPDQEPKTVARLLWADEMLEELRARGMGRGMSRLGRVGRADALGRSLSIGTVRGVIFQRLRARTWTGRKGTQPRTVPEAA